jgi:beta-lactamase class A
MECGAGSDWRGLSGAEIVAKWRSFAVHDKHEDAFQRLLEENARLSGAGFQHLYDERWGLNESAGYDDAFAIDQALDNPGSPRDMAELLAMIVESRCASAPSCRLMIEIMSRQEWRGKIPAGLPPGLRVANKTGGVAGTSNDAAIVYTPSGAPIVMVVFCRGLSYRATERAPHAIAEIAAELYEHLGEPA